jgi:hypothetical protein
MPEKATFRPLLTISRTTCEMLKSGGRECGKKFKLKASLKKHQQRAHSDGKIFECPYELCKSVFFSQCDLDKHVRYYHTRRSTCDYCEATFPFKSCKEKHESRYHPPGQEPFNHKHRRTCLLCGVRVANLDILSSTHECNKTSLKLRPKRFEKQLL